MILFSIGFPLTSHADCKTTLQWETNDSRIEGYEVFGREEGQDFDYDNPWWQGDSSFYQCTIDGLDEIKSYYFVIRAYAGDAVSPDSNEVRFSYGDHGAGNLAGDNGNGSAASGQSSSGCFVNSLWGALGSDQGNLLKIWNVWK